MSRAAVVLMSTLLALGCASVPEVSRPDLDVVPTPQWTGAAVAEGAADPGELVGFVAVGSSRQRRVAGYRPKRAESRSPWLAYSATVNRIIPGRR